MNSRSFVVFIVVVDGVSYKWTFYHMWSPPPTSPHSAVRRASVRDEIELCAAVAFEQPDLHTHTPDYTNVRACKTTLALTRWTWEGLSCSIRTFNGWKLPIIEAAQVVSSLRIKQTLKFTASSSIIDLEKVSSSKLYSIFESLLFLSSSKFYWFFESLLSNSAKLFRSTLSKTTDFIRK